MSASVLDRERQAIREREKHVEGLRRNMHAALQRDSGMMPAPKIDRNDWYVHAGNAHYANDKGCFTSYTSVDAQILCNGKAIRIAGFGAAEFDAALVLHNPDHPAMTLELNLCLHIPEAPCNGLSKQRMTVGARTYEGLGSHFSFAGEDGLPVCHGTLPSGRIILASEAGEQDLLDSSQQAFSPAWAVQVTRSEMGRCIEAQDEALNRARAIYDMAYP